MGRGDRLFKGLRTFGQKLCQESCSEEGEEQTKERGFLISEKVAFFWPRAFPQRPFRVIIWPGDIVILKQMQTYLLFCEMFKFIDGSLRKDETVFWPQ